MFVRVSTNSWKFEAYTGTLCLRAGSVLMNWMAMQSRVSPDDGARRAVARGPLSRSPSWFRWPVAGLPTRCRIVLCPSIEVRAPCRVLQRSRRDVSNPSLQVVGASVPVVQV